MSRLPQVNGDKGNWGKILNTWLKHIAGYRGVAPARPASGSLPSGVAINGNGYDTTDQYQSENSGLNFHNDFPANAPTGFTFIHTLHNRIYRKEGNSWAVLLEGVDSSNPYWSLTGNAGTNPNSNFLGTTDAQPLVIRTNNTERVRIDTNGNVGIGTVAPVAKLDVAGRVALSGLEAPEYGGASAGVAIIGTPNSGGGLLFRPAGLDNASGEVLFRSDASYFSGNVGIGTVAPWAKLAIEQSGGNSGIGIHRPGVSAGGVATGLQDTAGISLFSNWWGGFSGEPIRFGWAPWNGDWNNFTEVMRIHTNGNVGIGTVAPGARLDVVGGNIRATGEIIGTLGSGYGQFRAISGNYGIMLRNDGDDTYFLLTNSGDQYGGWNDLRPFIINNASGNVSLGNQTLYVQHSGNVGIGTTAPAQKLHVEGNVQFSKALMPNGDAGSPGQVLVSQGAGAAPVWQTLNSGNQGDQDWLVAQNDPNGVPNPPIPNNINQWIYTNGNVGIGTGAPANALHVFRLGFNPSQNDAAAIRVEGNWGGGIVFSENNNRSAIYSPNGSDLMFATGGSSGGIPSRVHIDSIGRVGVDNFPWLNTTLTVSTPSSHIDDAPLFNWGNSSNAYLQTYGQLIDRRGAVNYSQTRANNSSSISAFRQDALSVINSYSTSNKTFMNGVVTAVTFGPNPGHDNYWLHGLCETHMCMQTGPMHPQGNWGSPMIDNPSNPTNSFVGLGCRYDLAQVPNNCRPMFISCYSSDNIGPNWNDAGHFLVHARGHMQLFSPAGAVAYKNGNLTWANASDARLKTNIQPITNALEKITKLRGVSFDWINQDLHKGDAKSGFLAQEMEQVFPDCVQEVEVDSNSPDAKLVGDGKIKTVGLTTGFFASMVEAIKEQQQMIEGLQKTVAQQQQLIDLQNQKIAQLEQKLEELANKFGS